ncbi:MAG: resuscitation-promoting factor RpfB [Pseudonocardiales bacterium]|nr:resuscitation-promoting factor RpfB [Pseudonocardiales bacterium]
MLRSVKYGLYGAVIAGVVSGTVAWQGIDKTVHLVVDGSPSTVRTTAGRVSDVLHSRGYQVGPHDIVAPATSADVHNGSRIVLQRGRLLHLDINGMHQDVWTTAPTVAAAMAQLGYSTANFTSVSRDRRLPLTPTDLTIRTPQLVTIQHDGRTDRVATTDATVGQLLDDLGLALGPKDHVVPAAGTEITSGLQVVVHRLTHGRVTADKVLPYGTTVQQSATLPTGRTVVLSQGRAGLARVTYAMVWIDGKVVGRTTVSTVIVRKPVNRVVRVGSGSPAVPTAVVTPGSAQDIARRLVAARGWNTSEFNCLAVLWGHESGWRVNAANPSGAYGIPQALPGSKMGPGWQTDATVQITWGLAYIADRYSTPCGAWSAWQAQGGWY